MNENKQDEGSEPEDHELTAEKVAEDAALLFGADYKGEPASDADAPPPPG